MGGVLQVDTCMNGMAVEGQGGTFGGRLHNMLVDLS